jgi:hypothetical protein
MLVRHTIASFIFSGVGQRGNTVSVRGETRNSSTGSILYYIGNCMVETVLGNIKTSFAPGMTVTVLHPKTTIECQDPTVRTMVECLKPQSFLFQNGTGSHR